MAGNNKIESEVMPVQGVSTEQGEKEIVGLTVEKVGQLTDRFLNRIVEKLNEEQADTKTVHEDIRMIHHLIKLKTEVEKSEKKASVGIDLLAAKFFDRVMGKMDVKEFDTKMVHEDIRIMHHLAIMKLEYKGC